MRNKIIYTLALVLALASCGSHKDSVKDAGNNAITSTANTEVVKKVIDQKVKTQNIVGDMTFSVVTNGNDVSVPASLHMRKDQTIRIQLFVPILGTEIGRLEFTPDYVLIIDRMHKEYVKTDYSDLTFLSSNGLSFYSLQALFWNQLMLPGTHEVTEADASRFTAETTEAGSLNVTAKDGNLTCNWDVNSQTALISEADLSYDSTTLGSSTMKWTYSDFKNVNSKKFPATQSFNIVTKASGKKQQALVKLKMSEVKTDSKWDAVTNVSSKYKKVSADALLSKLLSM